MFALKRPCNNCPFKKGGGELFQLGRRRVTEIVEAHAFQCHKTVDYDSDPDGKSLAGSRPQQCAGLMGTLTNSNRSNTIMRAAQALTDFDPQSLALSECYESVDAALEAHSASQRNEEKTDEWR